MDESKAQAEEQFLTNMKLLVWGAPVVVSVALIFGLMFTVAQENYGKREEAKRCQERVNRLENTVDGSFALKEAATRPPVGVDMTNPCDKLKYLESKIH